MDKETQQRVIIPNYKRIYEDLLDKKYPHKKEACKAVLAKEKLSSMNTKAIKNTDRTIKHRFLKFFNIRKKTN